MKKIVLALVTISLLLTGCSDDGKKESAVSDDSVSPSVEMSASESESTATETVQTASDKAVQPETQNTTEKNLLKTKAVIPERILFCWIPV